MPDIKLTVKTEKHYSCVLRREDLIVALNKYTVLSHKLPTDTEVTITVPSGGDYSGDSLDIDECGGVQLTWVETTVSQP